MANTIAKARHLVGTNKIVLLEDVYSTDQGIGEICGITKINISDPLPTDAETYTARQLVTQGFLRRVKLRLTNKKTRVIYMLSANSPKIGGLTGLSYVGGLTVKTAYFPQKYTYTA